MRWLLAGPMSLAVVCATVRAEACGACATPELWDVQNLAGELVVVTNFGLLAKHGDGWRVTCEEIFGGLLLAARGNDGAGWVSTDIGPFRRTESACDWTPGALPQHASWAWKFALASGEGEGTSTRFVLVIDNETQELHVERARGDEDYRVVESFGSTSGFRELAAGGDPASVFAAGFGAGAARAWQVAFSLDAGDHWQTVVPEVPSETNWLLRFVDPRFPQAVFVESESVSGEAEGLWRFDAETGVMSELLSLADGEVLVGVTVLDDVLWVAARGDSSGSLYRADRGELAFSRVVVDAPPFGCLAAHSGALHACVNDFSYSSSFLLGRSSDEGKSWRPLLTVDDLGKVAGCGPECDRTLDWLVAAFGSAGAPSDASGIGGALGMATRGGEAGAGPFPEAKSAVSGCGCRLKGTPASGSALLLACLCVAACWCRRSPSARRLGVGWLVTLGGFALSACSGGHPEKESAAPPCGGRGDDLTSLELASGELWLRVLDTSPAPPGVGDNEWLVFMSDAADAPVTGLARSMHVTPFMPEHGHGTPVAVGVTEAAAGEYRLLPVNTFMPGLWHIRLSVSQSEEPELFEFSVCVE